MITFTATSILKGLFQPAYLALVISCLAFVCRQFHVKSKTVNLRQRMEQKVVFEEIFFVVNQN